MTTTPAPEPRVGRYLTTDEITNGMDRYHGVPACWIGDDGDAIAFTDDWRRGAAAVHALARHDLKSPVRGETDVVWAQFEESPHPDEEWVVRACRAGDPGAVRVVWASELWDYRPGLPAVIFEEER